MNKFGFTRLKKNFSKTVEELKKSLSEIWNNLFEVKILLYGNGYTLSDILTDAILENPDKNYIIRTNRYGELEDLEKLNSLPDGLYFSICEDYKTSFIYIKLDGEWYSLESDEYFLAKGYSLCKLKPSHGLIEYDWDSHINEFIKVATYFEDNYKEYINKLLDSYNEGAYVSLGANMSKKNFSEEEVKLSEPELMSSLVRILGTLNYGSPDASEVELKDAINDYLGSDGDSKHYALELSDMLDSGDFPVSRRLSGGYIESDWIEVVDKKTAEKLSKLENIIETTSRIPENINARVASIAENFGSDFYQMSSPEECKGGVEPAVIVVNDINDEDEIKKFYDRMVEIWKEEGTIEFSKKSGIRKFHKFSRVPFKK